MQWESVGQFFAMGGYGRFVWGSYAMTAAVVLIEVATLVRRHRTLRRRAGRSTATDSNGSSP